MENLYYLIPVVAIVGGITYAILASYWRSKRDASNPELQAALEANTAASKAIVEKLESIDTRLSAVENTLTDIP